MKQEKNYQALFVSGITFMGAGVVFLTTINRGIGAGLIIIGAVMMIIGGKNKNKWQKNEK